MFISEEGVEKIIKHLGHSDENVVKTALDCIQSISIQGVQLLEHKSLILTVL